MELLAYFLILLHELTSINNSEQRLPDTKDPNIISVYSQLQEIDDVLFLIFQETELHILLWGIKQSPFLTRLQNSLVYIMWGFFPNCSRVSFPFLVLWRFLNARRDHENVSRYLWIDIVFRQNNISDRTIFICIKTGSQLKYRVKSRWAGALILVSFVNFTYTKNRIIFKNLQGDLYYKVF